MLSDYADAVDCMVRSIYSTTIIFLLFEYCYKRAAAGLNTFKLSDFSVCKTSIVGINGSALDKAPSFPCCEYWLTLGGFCGVDPRDYTESNG